MAVLLLEMNTRLQVELATRSLEEYPDIDLVEALNSRHTAVEAVALGLSDVKLNSLAWGMPSKSVQAPEAG